MAHNFSATPATAELPDSVLTQICDWASQQRWYSGEAGSKPAPWLIGRFADAPELVILFARLNQAGTIIQIPLILTPAPVKEFEPITGDNSLIAIAILGGAPVAVYDGAGSEPAWRAYLVNMDDAETAAQTANDETWAKASIGAHLLTGEQSNSSVLLPGMGVIMKILRTLVPGTHPDVEVPRALGQEGFKGVPAFRGATIVELPEFGLTTLAIAAELVPNADDGFELAVQYATDGRDFSELARDFGTTLAKLHAHLANALPTDQQLQRGSFIDQLRTRSATASSEAPVLHEYDAAIKQVYDDLTKTLSPVPLQRIHGDLHLGQALHSSNGWQILDFEGEPLRPAEERSAPDLPLRDVAGALRSFDYAAGVAAKDTLDGHVDPVWAETAKRAFLDGYFHEQGSLPDADTQRLLDALVLDKALYETLYESRQRPTWVNIPLQAVRQIVES